MSSTESSIRAAIETAVAHGITPDRCEMLQEANTVVVRLTESLVARVVRDSGGHRAGGAWFERESAVAIHLAQQGAPVIPMHPQIPPGPHEHLGHTLNFWQFVTITDVEPDPAEIGKTLFHCHRLLRGFEEPLPKLAIMHESLELLEKPAVHESFDGVDAEILRVRLQSALESLESASCQPLHGDAHSGNLLNTTDGLLWTDWEDTFSGPVEWDLASIIWNARILDNDTPVAEGILSAYRNSGGAIDDTVLDQCLVARAAVMSIWYPVLYPNPTPERSAKLQRRLAWLRGEE